MKKNSRVCFILLCCVVCVASIFILSGCNKEDKDTTKADLISNFNLDTNETVVLNFYVTLENFPAIEEVIDGFETMFPNCSVKYSFKDSYEDTIYSLLADETTSKSTHLYMTNDGLIKKLTTEGILADCATDFYAEDSKIDISDINQEVSSYNAKEGKLYSIPTMLSARGMVVNETLLAEHDLTVPKTWTEFLNCCEVLYNDDLVPIQCLASELGICLLYPEIACDIVYGDNYEQVLKEANEFKAGSGENFRDEFSKYATLIEKGYYSYEESFTNSIIETSNYSPAILNFFKGDVAFFPCTAEVYSGMKKREVNYSDDYGTSEYDGFTYSYVGSPTDDSPYIYFMVYDGVTVNPTCDNNEWAQAFAEYLLMENNLQMLANEKGMISNTRNNVDPRYAAVFALDNTHQSNQAEFTINFFSELKYSFEKMYKTEAKVCKTDASNAVIVGDRGVNEIDIDKVVAYYEGKIASKRAQE